MLPSGTLVVGKVDASMKGSYTCEANNGFGKPLTKTIQLSVRGKLRCYTAFHEREASIMSNMYKILVQSR